MADTTIKFGTDGWRAVIAKQFTFDNLDVVAMATLRWLRRKYGAHPRIVLGHDTRFLGRAFAEQAARVFASGGATVIFADGFVPTPAISWATKEYGCNAGIVITASHNPPEYNGFKIKADFGGPASPEMIAEVEAELGMVSEAGMTQAFEALVSSGSILLRDVRADYVSLLQQRLDINTIKDSGLRVVHDAMFGAGQGIISELLGSDKVVSLHCDENPGFLGQAPEPIERNLGELARTILETRCDAGIANDGDADRVGMYDEEGSFVTSHLLLALLVKYLFQERGMRGTIVKTFSTTHMLDKMGAAYGIPVKTTPIGFKYIGTQIADGDVLVGGEESGGIAVKGHIPERDGIYIGLLILEMMVKRRRKLSELVQELYDEFGTHFTYRIDAHTTVANKESILTRLREGGGLTSISGHAVMGYDTLDGFKHQTDAGWLLVRPSGTEPVLRVYSEAPTPALAVALVEDAVTQLGVDEGT